MVDQRPTKRERRDQARAERRARELMLAQRQRRRRTITVITTAVVLVAVGIGAVIALASRPQVSVEEATVDPAVARRAEVAAGCVPVNIPELQNAPHLTPPAPSAKELYPVRPTSNGQHFGNTATVGATKETLDERLTTHNLEHGAVVVWYDPTKNVDSAALETWAVARNRSGFAEGAASGGGIIVAPFREGLSTGKAVALRAWRVAIDCDRFDQSVADSFLASTFGTHGLAPEKVIAPYPERALRFDPPLQTPSPGASAPGAVVPSAKSPSPAATARTTTGGPAAPR